MKRIAIIGGGISGLSAAFYLEKARAAGADLEYTLFESGQRLGGSMYSDRVEGCLVEAGPDSFLTEKPWALSLCKELGIADQLIGSNDAERKTYIMVNGRLVVMPDGLMFMVPTQLLPTALSSLFSWSTKLRMARELLHPPRPMHGPRRMQKLARHAQLGAPGEQGRERGGKQLGGHHEHKPVGHDHQPAVYHDVGFALGVVGADQLIGDAEFLAQRKRPGFFGEERVRPGFHQAALHAIGIHGPAEPLAAFKEGVFQIGAGGPRLLQIECGAQPGNASTDNGNALHGELFSES